MSRSNVRAAVYEAIDKEREEQNRQWGGAEHDDTHGIWDWNQYIKQHLHKGILAAKREPYDAAGYRHQLVRVAALAVAALESHDRLALKSPCRRCSECNGFHHWQEGDAGECPNMTCKHCETRITPVAPCPSCGGDLYQVNRDRWCTDCDFEEKIDAGKGGAS